MTFSKGAKAGFFTLTLAFLGWSIPANSAQPAPFNPAQKAAIEDIIRAYILDHPEILPEAMDRLQKRMTDNAVSGNNKAIYNDPDSIVGGNPRGDVTIVEFFDYTCGYCKLMNPALNQLVKSDGKIRFIYKEWPVRGPLAEVASKAAVAARLQGKYIQYHDALFAAQGQLSEERVFNIAKQQGLDLTRLKKDMESPQTKAILDRNHKLGQQLGFNGTPTFIVGREIIPGAVSLEEMTAAVKRARQANK